MIVPRGIVIARVKRIRRVMGALVMGSASTASARVSTAGVVLIVMLAALVTDSDAAATESALRANVIATPAGLGTVAISALVCTIAPNTGTATTGLACARKDIEAVIVHFRLSRSLASARFTASVVVSSSVPRCTRRKVPARRTSATPSARRSAFLSALPARCLSTSAVAPACRSTRSMCSDLSKAILLN